MWAAVFVQVFYLQESKRCKQREYTCEISACCHDEQKVCGHDYFSQLSSVEFAAFEAKSGHWRENVLDKDDEVFALIFGKDNFKGIVQVSLVLRNRDHYREGAKL